MTVVSEQRSRVTLFLILVAVSVLARVNTAATAAVSTVQTWPARPGPALSSEDVLKLTEIGGVSSQPGDSSSHSRA